MFKVTPLKVNELSEMTGCSKSTISKHLKKIPQEQLVLTNNRITGISPEAVEDYLSKLSLNFFNKPAVILAANLCGGVGKTTSIYNLGACLRRITKNSNPIVYIDGDSQGSFTSAVFGKPADDEDPILIDVLENKASLDDVITEIDENVWFVKSNLNQAWIDKILTKPQDIKNKMLNFYKSIFKKFGNKTKIFQDHTPQLSTLFASSVCALYQLDKKILKSVLIPIRSDKFAIHGASHILNEIKDLKDTFNLSGKIDIHCFFSSIDNRISSTKRARDLAEENSIIAKYLAPEIRYCSSVPKSIMSCNNLYSDAKNIKSKAAQDYLKLLQYIFSYQQSK